MDNKLNGRWDAAKFFEELTATTKLAQNEHFVFTELNNTPHTRRVKTVFFAMRYTAEDMSARAECMEIMR